MSFNIMTYVKSKKYEIRHIFNSTDYGLMAYRKENFEDMSTNFQCQNVYRIYCAPEVLLRVSTNFTAAADVYRLAKCLNPVFFTIYLNFEIFV